MLHFQKTQQLSAGTLTRKHAALLLKNSSKLTLILWLSKLTKKRFKIKKRDLTTPWIFTHENIQKVEEILSWRDRIKMHEKRWTVHREKPRFDEENEEPGLQRNGSGTRTETYLKHVTVCVMRHLRVHRSSHHRTIHKVFLALFPPRPLQDEARLDFENEKSWNTDARHGSRLECTLQCTISVYVCSLGFRSRGSW